MNLHQLYLTSNNCYKSGKTHTPKGLMWHSTGANNPNLNRYLPDDGLIGENQYGNHWNTSKPDGREICPHGFMGLLADGKTVATYQTLPWDMICWCSGSGSLGYARNGNNTGYLQIEICEDSLTDPKYFNKIYQEAIEVSACLARMFGFGIDRIIDHSEGHKMGIASNHGDVMHWFPKHGKSMDTLRSDVKKLLESGNKKTLTKGKSVQVGFFAKDGGQEGAEQYKKDLEAKGIPAMVVDAERYI